MNIRVQLWNITVAKDRFNGNGLSAPFLPAKTFPIKDSWLDTHESRDGFLVEGAFSFNVTEWPGDIWIAFSFQITPYPALKQLAGEPDLSSVTAWISGGDFVKARLEHEDETDVQCDIVYSFER
ncbi:hypothetical protein [Cupriavidus sp. RAF20_2]|uniref:hypothetical protein n=1 Tax=Cupriavidus sp. RAF20_2 TaxID=3233053 RepID=UPI003F927225